MLGDAECVCGESGEMIRTNLTTCFSSPAYVQLVQNKETAFGEKPITVSAASQNELSFLRVYFNNTGQVFPYLTAIIDARGGVVKGITWDDACVFCGGGDECQEITYDYNGEAQTRDSSGQPTKGCYYTEEQCNNFEAAENHVCDLTLYVVWTGGDSDGNGLLSSANRFSAFPAQEIQDRITRNLPSIPNPLN